MTCARHIVHLNIEEIRWIGLSQQKSLNNLKFYFYFFGGGGISRFGFRQYNVLVPELESKRFFNMLVFKLGWIFST